MRSNRRRVSRLHRWKLLPRLRKMHKMLAQLDKAQNGAIVQAELWISADFERPVMRGVVARHVLELRLVNGRRGISLAIKQATPKQNWIPPS